VSVNPGEIMRNAECFQVLWIEELVPILYHSFVQTLYFVITSTSGKVPSPQVICEKKLLLGVD
jgi:hypothetical protein